MTARTDLAFLRRRTRPERAASAPIKTTTNPDGAASTIVDARQPAEVKNPALVAFLSSRSPARADPAGASVTADTARAAPASARGVPDNGARAGEEPSADPSSAFEAELRSDGTTVNSPLSRFRPLPPSLPGVRRIEQGEYQVMDRQTNPVIMLSRTQSGVGAIQFAMEGCMSGRILGCAYETAGRKEEAVHHGCAPGRRRPLLSVTDTAVTLDLRQVGGLRRLLVYAASESGRPLDWEGALVATSLGGQRLYVPCSGTSPSLALLSLYNVDGHLVVRAEQEPVAGGPRQVCEAYDYDHLIWRNDFAPLTEDSSGH